MREEELKEKFKLYVKSQGYEIHSEYCNLPPDMIITKDGRSIAVELKGSRDPSKFSRALGQLIYAKIKFQIRDMWLVLPELPSLLSKEWINVIWNQKIEILCFTNNEFVILTPELLRDRPYNHLSTSNHSKKRYLQTDSAILRLLKTSKEGLTFYEIAKNLNLSSETIRNHLKKGLTGVKNEDLTVEYNKIRLK
jgi:DNA-binding transcriptional ArsR family regulator